MNNKLIYLILLAYFSLLSCQNKDDFTNSQHTDAIILYTGAPEVDGCGFMIKIQDELYKPLNLPAEYEKDSVKVKIDYEIDLEGYFCGDMSIPKTTIRLLEIYKE